MMVVLSAGLLREPLELGDAGVVLGHRVVHGAAGQNGRSSSKVSYDEIEGAVGQAPEASPGTARRGGRCRRWVPRTDAPLI